jgi:hypothetical protein
MGRRKLYPIFGSQLRPTKIELFSVVFPRQAVERNWTVTNRKFFLLPPVRPTHVPALLSLVFVPPSTAPAVLHHAPPPQPIVPPLAGCSPPPSRLGCHAATIRFRVPARSGHRAAITSLLVHHRWPACAITVGASSGSRSVRAAAPRPPRRLLRLPSA